MSKDDKKGPSMVAVEKGKEYNWCACGHTKSEPFCDGAHKGSGVAPRKWMAPESKTVAFCTCKKSKNPVLCDGSHKSL